MKPAEIDPVNLVWLNLFALWRRLSRSSIPLALCLASALHQLRAIARFAMASNHLSRLFLGICSPRHSAYSLLSLRLAINV